METRAMNLPFSTTGRRPAPEAFRTNLADSRTFGLAEDVARLHAAGLALGGSLA
ncbi:MAG: UDP-3-O-[3-hydroxymyristoyl] N-acetylglucosamine deacetylase, partial [Planctomycetia bacterium]|nr:UDP-3-O-[3-hydroxymyristoyl] N-acetylglucosamine deacetylase [Planctomycetia bacterium]